MIIGIDLGGTKIAGVLCTPSGKVLTDVHIPTEASQGKKHVIANIKKAISHLANGQRVKIQAIGIGAPGPIIYDEGIVVEAPNLPGWKRVNLKKILQKEFKFPVFVDNDANCAALAEARFGAGKSVRHFLYLTISTGIGGGIIIDKKLYRGAIGAAGEIGHMTIDYQGQQCSCGRLGCLEALASGTALKRKTGLDALSLELAACQGDKKAQKAITELAHYLAIGIGNLVNIFNPQLIVIGGGLSNMRGLLFDPLKKEFKRYALTLPAQSVKIVRAKLGTQAGPLGAAALCL
ncbi:transcriptional regulator [Candidatus Saganbacteria bacterium CG08_land_8_20_14_0_20_45_16]|uniref:Transcriptional regulator n=1 Tax=Candidatus Saganbacteria bacterium CG08_land_8_20_14_0_20_45_16 TaxID=2014293 RepID=A0A2H0XZD1_UNCSA|nr:MAG: transcriptional regulator [Candidatus Saganbacteria bacterium CG08_land_8_20_14_0_20_45_16]